MITIPCRPRIRFRLATLLVAVAALCVGLKLIGDRAYRQTRAVAHLQRLGATLYYDFHFDDQQRINCNASPSAEPVWAHGGFYEDYLRKVIFVSVRDIGLTDDDLTAISSLRDLESLEFHYADFSSVRCEPLARLSKLKTLKLSGCSMGKCDLASIGQISSLQQLIVSGTDLDDACMPDLSNLMQLKFLNLENTRVSGGSFGDLSRLSKFLSVRLVNTPFNDAGMKALATSSALSALTLERTSVTDDSLGHLSRLKRLGRLVIIGAPITHRGLNRFRPAGGISFLDIRSTRFDDSEQSRQALDDLRAALPRCHIQVEGPR